MTEQPIPEIESATEALQRRITITEQEIADLKESLRTKKLLLLTCRKALATFNPKSASRRKAATTSQS